MPDNRIDFVLLWVDEKDPKWIEEKNKDKPGSQDDASSKRYRDWENLQYIFRGIEKFAPWVDRVFFITCGHLPKWLNKDHPKLRIVRHDEYMPREVLPTFNSNPIELYLNRISDLSERFVLFNDDMFLINKTRRQDFFYKGLPCDTAYLNIHSIAPGKMNVYASLQAIGVINKYFDMRKCILRNPDKWFSLRYGTKALKTLYLLPCPSFPEIGQMHLPYSYLKKTFDTVWAREGKLLSDTCRNRFRTKLDYSHWTMRDWQIASGRFYPRRADFGKSFALTDKKSLTDCIEYMRKSSACAVCINDADITDDDFQIFRDAINSELQRILPEKSRFEL